LDVHSGPNRARLYVFKDQLLSERLKLHAPISVIGHSPISAANDICVCVLKLACLSDHIRQALN
jgi:hypothetical protein